MYVSRPLREELNALSLEVFGASSRWQKLVNKGYAEIVTEEVTEFVPGKDENDPGEERKVRVPLKTKSGDYQSVTTRHTVESIHKYMLDRKKQLDEVKAHIKKAQEEQRAKREAENQKKMLHEELAGSAT